MLGQDLNHCSFARVTIFFGVMMTHSFLLPPRSLVVEPPVVLPCHEVNVAAEQPQIFDRLHQDHAKRMWILEADIFGR